MQRENQDSFYDITSDKEYVMGIRFCFIVLIGIAGGAFSQTVKSSVEFYDTVANKKMSEIGSSGSAAGSTFFIEENGTKRLVISRDTVVIDGSVKAGAFVGNGSKLTGVTVDSISWDKIKNIPAGFADGVDNSGAASIDSVKRAAFADSSKLAGSVSWKNIIDIPAGFADGTDNAGSGEAQVADSVRASKIADSSKTVMDGSITRAKFASGIKINADSLGNTAASNYALKMDVNNSMGIAYIEDQLRKRGQAYPITFTSPNSYNSIKITTSDSGYIMVSGFAEIECESDTGIEVYCMISDVTPSTANYGGYGVKSLIREGTVKYQTSNYSQTRVFKVDKAGTYTYNLFVWRLSSSGSAYLYNNGLTAIYIKNCTGDAVIK